MSQSPLISIVTPSMNCSAYLKRSIDSIVGQNYQPFEHIVMDGGSTDGTVEILKEYPHIQWKSERDSGEGEAINKALKAAKGDIIGWLNADDYYQPGVFQAVAATFTANPQVDLIYGNATFVDESNNLLLRKNPARTMSLPFLLRWWRHMEHPHAPAVFYSRRYIEKVGYFNDSLHFSLDYEYWLRGIVCCRFMHLDKQLAAATIRDDSKSTETGPEAAASHFQVSKPYHERLSLVERALFWTDYFLSVWLQDKLPILKTIRMKVGLRTRLRKLAAGTNPRTD